MKKSLLYFLISAAIVIILVDCCKEKELTSVDPDGSIKFLTFENKGCISSFKLSESSNEQVFNKMCTNGSLTYETLIELKCGLEIDKDSVIIIGNNIKIYLSSPKTSDARCICDYKEIFNFTNEGFKKLNVSLYYKYKSGQEYELLKNEIVDTD